MGSVYWSNYEMLSIDENPFPFSTEYLYSSDDLHNLFGGSDSYFYSSWEYNYRQQDDHYQYLQDQSYLYDPIPLMEYYPTTVVGFDPIQDEFLYNDNNGIIGFGVWDEFGLLGYDQPNITTSDHHRVGEKPLSLMCNDNIDRRESNYGDNHDGKGKDIIIKEERKVNNKRPYRSSSVLVISEEKSSSKRLSKEVLSKYYYMPITQAAKELNVGLTLLKKRNGESNNEENDSRYKKYIELLEREKKLVEEVPDVELNEGTKRLRQACFKNNYKKRKMITTTTTTMDYCSTTDLEEEEDDEIKFLLSDSFSSSS
ncbi:hypothetical protein G4B88_027936, partial [Cannabis sativa]